VWVSGLGSERTQVTDFESEYFAKAAGVLAVDKDVVDVSLQLPLIINHQQPVNGPPRILGQLTKLIHQLSNTTSNTTNAPHFVCGSKSQQLLKKLKSINIY